MRTRPPWVQRLRTKNKKSRTPKRNIRRTPMVEANFRAFEQFAIAMQAAGIKLIILEGESHPEMMQVYPKSFRIETRDRLQNISDSTSSDYVVSDRRPKIGCSRLAGCGSPQ